MNDLIQDIINDQAGRSAILDAAMKLSANDLVFLIAPLLLLLWFWPVSTANQAQNQRVAALAFLSTCLALALGMLISHLHYEARPFVSDRSTRLLISHAVDNAFPSDHATVAFAVAGTVVWFKRRPGVWLLGAATLIGVARIYVGVHWPSDVAGAALLGLLSATLLRNCEGLLVKPQRALAGLIPQVFAAEPIQ
jgi:undecaprenyl-diphosphatase